MGATDPAPAHVDAGSRAWRVIWRAGYVVARRLGPVVRLLVTLQVMGYDTGIVELGLVGRRTGRPRPILVTLIRVAGQWYVGHPNGHRPWLANLAAADSLAMTLLLAGSVQVRPVGLGLGPERDAVIRATAEQQPMPGRLLYMASQGHIRRAGIYYRLEPVDDPDG